MATRHALRALQYGPVKSSVPLCRISYARYKSTGSTTAPSEPATASLSPRWLSDLKQRIGKCITFGLQPHQVDQAGGILSEIAKDWRDLVAGSEGYLTGPNRRGMHRQAVVWGEMDSMGESCSPHSMPLWCSKLKLRADVVGHVNNVTYNRYAESARVNWAQKYATHIDPKHRSTWSELWTPTGVGMILRSIRTDFKFPMTWPDHISVYHKLGKEPGPETDSFILDVLILSERHQRPAARCVEDIVVYDYNKGKKAPLQSFMAEAFQETWRLQEEAKKTCSDRVRSLLDRVRQLEKDSWDRADAKEDFGSAGQ